LNKSVLVTGAEGSIGSVIANSFIEKNYLVYRTDSKATEIDLVNYFRGDLSEDLIYNKFENWLSSKKIDILINCAGITVKDVNIFNLETYRRTLKINLEVPFKLSGFLIAQARERNARFNIINITSLGAHLGFPTNPSYQISKAGLAQLAKSISVDYSKFGIRANNVVPGYIESNMTQKSFNDSEQNELRSQRSTMKRWGKPQDLIGVMHFLASDESEFITGADIFVDGGWNINGLST
jgi:NAD(P)-dependent dehydrogenase (short-subunit alcohol dehydrogenase family)